MSQIAETLTKQIATAEAMLQKVAAIPDGMHSPHLSGFIRYDEKYTRPLTIEADGWETETRELLRVLYGEDSRQVTDFLECTRGKHQYMKFREELHEELNRCIAFLKALLKVEGMKYQMASQQPKEERLNPPLVFISHAELDKEFANEIVTLLEFIGIKGKENLLCTSVDGYRIPLGKDIVEYLRYVFNSYKLFVIILHTHNYYDSIVCLNEMGAAWALKTQYYSVLAPDFEFSEMSGVVNNKEIAIKIGADDCEARVNQLKNKLVDFFGLPNPNEDRWPYYRNMFISNCLKFKSFNTKSNKQLKVEKEEPQATSLVSLTYTFRVFKEGNGCYPFQIDVKFASQEEDVYFKTITLSNKKRGVEITGHNVENDIMKFVRFIRPNILNIDKVCKTNYRAMVSEKYKTSLYVEDHKLAKKALETMSFHGLIALKRQMDGYDDLPLEGWDLHVTYNVNSELVIPMNASML